MSTTRLPELPKPSQPWPYIPSEFFNADQMHAYGLAVWKAAIEAAARVCQEYEAARWHDYKRGHGPERASDYCQGQSDGGGDCAEAIRGIPDPSALPLPELAGSPQERREE